MTRFASAYASSTSRRTSAAISRAVPSLNAGGFSSPESGLRATNAWKPNLSLMPKRQTMSRAIWVACAMSCAAPVEMSPSAISSAMRPPQQRRISERK